MELRGGTLAAENTALGTGQAATHIPSRPRLLSANVFRDHSRAERSLFWLLAAGVTFAIGAAVSTSLGSLQQWPRFLRLIEGLIS